MGVFDTNYKKVQSFEVANDLKAKFNIAASKSDIEEYLDDNYVVFEWVSKPKSNPLFRLTAPFYFLFVILAFIGMVFKWLWTGIASYETDGWVYPLVKGWKSKLGI